MKESQQLNSFQVLFYLHTSLSHFFKHSISPGRLRPCRASCASSVSRHSSGNAGRCRAHGGFPGGDLQDLQGRSIENAMNTSATAIQIYARCTFGQPQNDTKSPFVLNLQLQQFSDQKILTGMLRSRCLQCRIPIVLARTPCCREECPKCWKMSETKREDKTVLEVGSGSGILAIFAAQAGWRR